MNEFGSYIKKVRESKNMTLNQVALYAEISAAQLSRIETGKRGTPKPPTIEKIARALKVDYNELMEIAGYLELETSKQTQLDKDEAEFQAFANDPELEMWYKELPKSDEEELRKLRTIWEMIKNEKK
nr:helix-turn-helix transcriptional regulator [Lysinibacillus sphaericus]